MKILKDAFTQSDNETFSFIRLFVLPPSIIIFNISVLVFSLNYRTTLLNISFSYLAFFFACGIGAFFFRLYEDGTLKKVMGNLIENKSL